MNQAQTETEINYNGTCFLIACKGGKKKKKQQCRNVKMLRIKLMMSLSVTYKKLSAMEMNERLPCKVSKTLWCFKRAPTALRIDHVDLNNMFTKCFNDTSGIRNANRDFDMDGVCVWDGVTLQREEDARRGDGGDNGGGGEEKKNSRGTREGADRTAALQVLVRGAGKVGCR